MNDQLKEGNTYHVESGNIASLSVVTEKCYTDDTTRQVLIIEFKRGPKYRYWPATLEDLERGCKANENHELSTWFNDFKNRDYEKIIE